MGSTISSYLYSTDEEISISKNERLSYVTMKEIRFVKPSTDKYYSICRNQTWITEKKIPRGTYLTIVRVVKDSTGQIRMLAQFDQETELFDIAYSFVDIDPLVPRPGWLQDSMSTSLFIPRSKTIHAPPNNILKHTKHSY